MKIGIYCRVSTEEQKKYGVSLRDQEMRGVDFCIKNGYEYEVFVDAGYSGDDDIEKRPALSRLIDKILLKSREIDGVFAVDIDRLTRNPELGFFLKRLFLEKDIKLYNLDGIEINLKDENEDLMVGIKLLLSGFELKKLKVRIKRALERNAIDGKVMGGAIQPYGYMKGKNNLMEIDEEEGNIVKRIFDLCIGGNSTYKIADILNKEGILTKRTKIDKGYMTIKGIRKDKFIWRDAVIYNMLKNPLYKGQRRFKGNLYPCPILVEEDKFELVQRILEQRNNFKDTRNKYFYLLKGLIVCPVCGLRFYGRKREDLKDNQYICCSQRYKSFCGNRGINIDKLNTIVWDLIQKLPSNIEKILIENKDEYKKDLEKQLIKYNNKKEKLTTEVSKILDLFRINDLGREVVKERLEQLEIEIKNADNEINRIERQIKIKEEHNVFVNDIKQQLKEFSKKEINEELKQKVIRTYVKVIYLKWLPLYNNHLIVVQFDLDKYTDLNLQGLVEVKYKVNGWRYDNQLVKYGIRAVLPEFDIKVVNGKKVIRIKEDKLGLGIRIEDDLFNITRTKSLDNIIKQIKK